MSALETVLLSLVSFGVLFLSVTMARAIELNHPPTLVAGLAFETSKTFQDGGEKMKMKPTVSRHYCCLLHL